jgi:hypothetical protein
MGNFRKLGAIILCAYAVFIVGGYLHSHPQETQQWSLHCKLCQISQTSLEQSGESQITPNLSHLGFCVTEVPSHSGTGWTIDCSGRSPPLA